jgi:predicted component of type VI protein secretion system
VETTELKEPLRAKKGQTYEEDFEFFDGDDVPVDVSDYTFTLDLREREDSSVVAASAVCTIPQAHVVRVTIAASVMNTLKVRSYKTDIRGAKAGGIVDYLFEGEFIVDHAITQS